MSSESVEKEQNPLISVIPFQPLIERLKNASAGKPSPPPPPKRSSTAVATVARSAGDVDNVVTLQQQQHHTPKVVTFEDEQDAAAKKRQLHKESKDCAADNLGPGDVFM